MRIPIRNPLRNPLNFMIRDHVRTRLRIRLDIILLAIGALLMILGFFTDGQPGRGRSASNAQFDVSSWMMFGGLVVVACGALLALRRSYPQ